MPASPRLLAATLGSLSTLMIASTSPWQPTTLPPGAGSAPAVLAVGGDTAFVSASAWWDFQPKVNDTRCGAASDAHPLHVVVQLDRRSVAADALPRPELVWLAADDGTWVSSPRGWSDAADPRYSVQIVGTPHGPVIGEGEALRVVVRFRSASGATALVAVATSAIRTY